MKQQIQKQLTAALTLVCIAGIFGCTPKFIVNVDGYPSPEEINVSWTPDRAVTLKWFYSRWFMKRIESGDFSEEIEYTEHLSFDGRNVLPPDTRGVAVNLQVHNPSMKKYKLVKRTSVENEQMEELVSGWTIRQIHHTAVAGPLVAGREVLVSVEIVLDKGEAYTEQILSTGELSYIIEPSGAGCPEANRGR